MVNKDSQQPTPKYKFNRGNLDKINSNQLVKGLSFLSNDFTKDFM